MKNKSKKKKIKKSEFYLSQKFPELKKLQAGLSSRPDKLQAGFCPGPDTLQAKLCSGPDKLQAR